MCVCVLRYAVYHRAIISVPSGKKRRRKVRSELVCSLSLSLSPFPSFPLLRDQRVSRENNLYRPLSRRAYRSRCRTRTSSRVSRGTKFAIRFLPRVPSTPVSLCTRFFSSPLPLSHNIPSPPMLSNSPRARFSLAVALLPAYTYLPTYLRSSTNAHAEVAAEGRREEREREKHRCIHTRRSRQRTKYIRAPRAASA